METRRAIDRRIYEEELRPWLPPAILDFHVHVSLKANCGPVSPERYRKIWALEVGIHQTWSELRSNYEYLFPEKEVSSLAFGGIYREIDTDADNRYVLAGASDETNRAAALFVSRPGHSPDRVANALSVGFKGIKPYPDFAPQGMEDASVFDFLPREHLKVLNDFGGILMLHLPRPGRLKDPDNIREVLEISDGWPNVTIILAHIGRAYCAPNARAGLKHYRDHDRIFLDTSANLNAEVFQLAIETLGTERILFGSDLPITMLRGVREHEGDSYTNFTNEPYTWNRNRKSPEEEACYTSFVYQELRAIIKAVKQCGLGPAAMEKIMFSNGARLLGLALESASQGAAAVR